MKDEHWVGTLAWGAAYVMLLLLALAMLLDGYVYGAALVAVPVTLGYTALMIALWRGDLDDW